MSATTLTHADVRDIRTQLAHGARGARLATRYGVTPSAISKIKLGINWAARTGEATCRNGHPTERYGYVDPRGHTRCRACRQNNNRRQSARQRSVARERFRAEHAGHILRPAGGSAQGLACVTCRYADVDDAVIHRIRAGFPPERINPGSLRAAVVQLSGEGATNAAIARMAGVCERTVERHLAAARRAA